MRRPAPRPLRLALAGALEGAQPPTLLGAVQAVWADATGPVLAAETEPVSERDGTVTATCSSAVWAQELELMAPDLLGRLNACLTPAAHGRVERLRFRVSSGPNHG